MISKTPYVKQKSQIQAITIFFLVSPFLALIQAIRNFRAPYAKNVVWLFTIFYGLTFVISDKGMDANRYVEDLVYMHRFFTDFADFYEYLLADVDYLLPIVVYLVSLFTDQSKFLMASFAIIFGFFFSRNIWFLVDKMPNNAQKISLVILVVFVFSAGIWKITNFRWWTALHVFIYGLLPYLYYNKKKYLVYCLLSPLIHFSFYFPVFIFILYLFIGNRLNLYFILFCLSLFLEQLDLSVLKNQLDFLPQNMKERSDPYANEEYLEATIKTAEEKAWYIRNSVTTMNYGLLFLILYIYFKFKDHIISNAIVYRFFSFALFIYAICNFVSSVPSVWRFMTLAQMMAAATVFLIVQVNANDKNYQRILTFATPFFLLFIYVTTRVALDTIGVNTIIGNVISALSIYEDYALIQVLR